MKRRKETSAYMPKIFDISPDRIIPYHMIYRVKLNLFLDYKTRVYVPPIPIVKAPKDLRHLGDYVNYNGHHRTVAASLARVSPSCMLLEDWQDILYLIEHPPKYHEKVYPELIESLDETFEAHRDFVWSEARRFQRLQEIARKKGLKTL